MPSLRALFDQLVDLSPSERTDRLRDLALPHAAQQTLLEMLEDEANWPGILAIPIGAALESLREDDDLLRSLIGRSIGPFRVLDLVGEGGTSAVFRADRAAGSGAQIVALKLLRTGFHSPDAQRRFHREQAILAQLSHPDIAHLIEGGISEAGIPYIAMEFVGGESITRAAERLKLDLRQRLRLLVRLCRAVDAAHAALVVHCDLKPSNVLVDSRGNLKVLDFGIAVLLDGEAGAERSQQLALTPEYAAPEQYRRAQPTVALDIYALGVVLGELLTGQRLRAGSAAASSMVLAAAIGATPLGLPAPKALARSLRGDLDAIIATALAEDPSGRYRSAEALALDIERHLCGYPVRARPATLLHRAGKFVGRHRGGVALTALLVIGMLVSLVLALSQGMAARRDAAAAHAAVARADSLRDFMFDAFGEAEPGAPKDGPASIVDVIERALADIETESGADPRVRIELQTRLAQVMSRQGKAERAGEVLAGAEAFAQRQLAPDDPLRFELDQVIADNMGLRGQYAEALRRTDKLLAQLPADASLLRIRALTNSAWIAGRLHQQERGLRDGRAALELARAHGDERELQQAQRALGTVLLEFDQVSEAISLYEGLLARERAQYGPVHTRVAAEEAALARAYRRSGDLERAEAHARAAIAIDHKVYSGDHWHTGLHLNALTMVLVERRAFDQALVSQAESQRINSATMGEDHPEVLMGAAAQGLISGQLGDWPAAVALTRRAVDALALGQHDRTRNGVRAHRALGFALAMNGARREGEAELEKAFAIASTLDASVAEDKVEVLERMARVALMAHDLARADESIARLVEQAATLPPSTDWAGRIEVLRGEALFQRGRMSEAMEALDAAATELARSTRPHPVETVVVAVLRAVAARELGESARADELTRDARTKLAALPFPPPHLTRYAASLPAE